MPGVNCMAGSMEMIDGFLMQLNRQIADRWHTPRQPRTPRAYRCLCGAAVFFRNSACLSCGRALGYAPHERTLLALEPRLV